MKKLNICSVTIGQKEHGLHIYSQHIQKFVKTRLIKYHEYHFDEDNTSFSQPLKNRSEKHNEDFIHNNFDILLIQYDTESLFGDYNFLVAWFKNIFLMKFILKCNLPTVITVHGLFDDTHKYGILGEIGAKLFIYILSLKIQINFLFLSLKQFEHFKNIFPKIRKNFFFVPHIVYPELVQFKARPEKKGKFKLLTLGFIGPWKGQLEIIRIINKLSRKINNFEYMIIGKSVDSIYFEKCMSLAKNNSAITILNKFISPKEFNYYLSKADIYLDYHSRKGQTSSGTLMHAYVLGKKIVARNFPFISSEINKNIIIAESEYDYSSELFDLLYSKKDATFLDTKNYKKINKYVIHQYLESYRSVNKK